MAGELTLLQSGAGVLESIFGISGRNKERRRIQRLMAQRKAYETPEETYDALQLTQNLASQGVGDQVLSYLTGNADKAMMTSVEAASLLGGDANTMGSIFEQRMSELNKIAAMDNTQRMENMSKYLSALSVMSQSKAAEQISRDNLIKDQIQAAAAQGADYTKMLGSGISNVVGGISNYAAMKIFDDYNGNEFDLNELFKKLKLFKGGI